MKAIVWTAYGPPDVLQLQDVEKPIPKPNEVLIKIHAATAFPGDCELRRFELPHWFLWLPVRILVGIRKPRGIKILGQELAGEIVSVGQNVQQFGAGDRVFAATEMHMSAYAEYVCLPGKGPLAGMPAAMTYEEAATVPVGGTNALHFLRRANIQRGEKVLINGGAGVIGTFAIQIAKAFGAEVVAVDHTDKLAAMRAIGADRVIDFTKDDFTEIGESYDVIFDIIGTSSYRRSVRSLTSAGRYLLVQTKPSTILHGLWTAWRSTKKVICELASTTADDLAFLADLIEAGNLQPVIDRCYPLEQTVEAHRYVESGQKIGHVVICVQAAEGLKTHS